MVSCSTNNMSHGLKALSELALDYFSTFNLVTLLITHCSLEISSPRPFVTHTQFSPAVRSMHTLFPQPKTVTLLFIL